MAFLHGVRGQRLRVLAFAILVCLSACSWFGAAKKAPPQPAELIVTGAPMGSIAFVDGSQAGAPAALNDHPQILNVAPGSHKLEIHMGDAVVYREDTYVRAGEHRMVRVLSGFAR